MKSYPRVVALFAVALTGGCSSAPAPVAVAAPEAAASQRGAWYWAGSATVDGYTIAADPSRYTIEFTDDTTMQVQADCNRGSGSYVYSSPRQFTPGPIALTKMGCAPESQDGEFLAQLGNANSRDEQTDFLRVDFADAGSMFFARNPETRVRRYQCTEGGVIAAAFGASSALVFVDRSWRILPQVSGGSGIRYGDGAALLETKGDAAALSGVGAMRFGCRAQS